MSTHPGCPALAQHQEQQALQQRLLQAEEEIASVRKKLAEIAARPQELDNSPAGKASRLPVPYVPAGGPFYFGLTSHDPHRGLADSDFRKVGAEYTTMAAATAGLEYRDEANARVAWAKARHLLLLMRLAHDLNPNGEVSGAFFPIFMERRNPGNQWEFASRPPERVHCVLDGLFVTLEAAREACRILNRDGVVPPGIQNTETSSSS